MADANQNDDAVKIRFTQEYEVKDENSFSDKQKAGLIAQVKKHNRSAPDDERRPMPKFPEPTVYKKGEVKTFTSDSAFHFLRKGVAERVPATAKAKA